LFNRSANMTGRLPLWEYLIENFVGRRPLIGYGFGAFWQQPAIMEKIRSAVGWKYLVRVSDNGYMDVLLGLGIIGLLILIGLLVTGFARTIKTAFRGRDLIAFFPLMAMVHIVLINVSLSYFFENEYFIWFLLMLVLFMAPSRIDTPKAIELK